MKINNLENMEAIVSKNSNLFWDGWTVCTYLDEDGFYSSDGVFLSKTWLIKKRFEFVNGNWEIPDRFVKNV
jgi:hypothetical protein